jgi:hypothetical protein
MSVPQGAVGGFMIIEATLKTRQSRSPLGCRRRG